MSSARNLLGITLLLIVGINLGSCSSAYKKSVGGETSIPFERIYITDFNTAWQSVLDALKYNRLDVSNKEAGSILTRWTDNTVEKNFADSFGGTDAYLKAQYRFQINVAKGFYNGEPTIKVSVQKEQLIMRDVLDGWRPNESDSIEEKTLLYRIGRLIYIKMKLAKLEEERIKEDMNSSEF